MGREVGHIVSQEFHLPRSLFLADKLGVDAVAVSADLRTYGPMSSRRAKVREFLARTGAWVDMNILRTKPEVPRRTGKPLRHRARTGIG